MGIYKEISKGAAMVVIGNLIGCSIVLLLTSAVSADALIQSLATLSIPFLYFFLVERKNTARKVFQRFVEDELTSIINEVRSAYELHSYAFVEFMETGEKNARSVAILANCSIRLVTLRATSSGSNREDLTKYIGGIERFVGEFKEHLLGAFSEIKDGEITLDTHGKIMITYSNVMYNYSATILHLHGIPLKEEYLKREAVK